MSDQFVQPAWIRTELVRKILVTFKASLPIYEQMIGVAEKINTAAGPDESQRLGRIMHAAIRCATDQELQTVKDLFSLMGCEPVNYYDLRERVAVESTAFRPVAREEIERNGFRVFCSKLSLDCVHAEHYDFVQKVIARRDIFGEDLLALIETGKTQGGFAQDQAEQFIERCTNVFTRPNTALVSLEEYEKLQTIHKVAAQILVCNALAFNHLTPSVASVKVAHAELQRQGIETIPVWQGPVGKNVILRQTSCLAPAIMLRFPEGDGTHIEAPYQETFVEFEERLQALTPAGRELFESLFNQGKKSLTLSESDPNYAEHYYKMMTAALADFPGDLWELWQRRLAYFTFEAETANSSLVLAGLSFDECIQKGFIKLVPQQYEDFFGPAATNIFNSNIGLAEVSNVGTTSRDSQQAFETALGREVMNMYDYYAQIEADSRDRVCAELGLDYE